MSYPQKAGVADPASPSIAARLNRLPVGRTHRLAIVIIGIGTFFDLFDIFLAGVLGTALTEQFQLSRLALPAVIGSGFVGMFFGATLLGRSSNHPTCRLRPPKLKSRIFLL